MTSRSGSNPWLWLGILIVFALLIRLIALGALPLQDPSEARYGEMVRLMLETGHWLTALFDYDQPFLGKPPLFIWLAAISASLFGLSEFTVRLPSLLCALVTLWLCWKLARFQMGPRPAWLSLLILTSTAVFLVLAGGIISDPVLLLSITLIISGFWIGWHSDELRQARCWQYLFFAGCGLGLLAKGLVALALTGLPIFLWCLPQRRLIQLWQKFPWGSGILLTLLIAAPWYIATEIRYPGFMEYFFIGEHFSRYLESGWDGDLYGNAHSRPLGKIWILFLQGGIPWSLILLYLVVQSIWLKTKGNHLNITPWESFLWLWLLAPLLFFSFSKNLIWTYALPAAPPMALLLASRWKNRFDQKPLWILITASITPVLVLLLAIAFAMDLAGKPSQKQLMQAVDRTPLSSPGEIIYWQFRPFSGRYYSKGKALLIKDTEHLQQTINNDKQDRLIARQDEFEQLPDSIQQQFTLQVRYRDWGYWLEKQQKPTFEPSSE